MSMNFVNILTMVIQTLTGKDSILGVEALWGSCRDIPKDCNNFVLSYVPQFENN